MRRTVSAEMLDTTPSRTHFRAIAVPSHGDNDRPRSSGRSRAIWTTESATSGRKDRLTAGPGAMVPGGAADFEEK
jgi:hypothetical protein